MADIRPNVSATYVAEPEPNKFAKYAGNVAAACLGATGLCALIFFVGPPVKDVAGPPIAKLVKQIAPVDFSTATSNAADIVRAGILTESVSALDAMEVLGANRQHADAALASLRTKGLIDKTKLKAGLSITVHLEPGERTENGRTLNALTLRTDKDTNVIAKRRPSGEYFSAELNSRLILSHRRITGNISTSLTEDLLKSGASKNHVHQFTSVFDYDAQIAQQLHKGDEFEAVVEIWQDERGQHIETGDLVYASLKGAVIARDFYKYTPNDSEITDFFDEYGNSAESFLLPKPINGAPISSRFGRRKHPIGGYMHTHRGVDFRAPMNTRIYAAGDGIVERVGRNGGYGRHVLIRHANGYKTGYAHMSAYSEDLYVGARIKQGDLVGFVGSSGHSTGPHLHYEVIKNGRHVDPMSLQLPTGQKLAARPAELDKFKAHRANIDKVRRNLGARIDVADNTNGGVSAIGSLYAEAP